MRRRLWAVPALMVGVLSQVVLAAPVPALAKPTVTAAERAAAIVAPAMVNLEIAWQGYVRHKVTGALVDDQSISLTTHCGGFAVSSDGYLVTTGRCVDPASVALSFFQQVADRRVAQGLATPDQAALLLADLVINGTIVGQPVDSPPKRTVTVRRGVTPDDPLNATVVSIAPPTAGDVALLKIEKNNQPLIHLAAADDVKPGLAVLTVEYGAGASASSPPTARTGSIAQTDPVLLANAGPSDSVPGAPVLTLDGDVVGVLSRHQPSVATDVLSSVAVIAAALQAAKGANELSSVDRDYRDGLDAYYDGRYTDAIEMFDAVLAVIPSHVQAHDFREQAQALREAEGGGRHADSGMFGTVRGWLGGALGPLAAAALVAGLALVLVRRRGHTRDTPPADTAAPAAPTAPAASTRIRLKTPLYCANCSNALPEGADTCPRCGDTRATRLTGEVSEKIRKTHR